MRDNYGLDVTESTFRQYISRNTEYQAYFDARRGHQPRKTTFPYETAAGEQAQLDWKEDIAFTDVYGKVFKVNVLVLVLGFSRLKLFYVTLDRKRETLLHALTCMFEKLEGVPKQILTDNMKSIVAIDSNNNGRLRIDPEVEEFGKVFGCTFKTCRVRSPQTKGKVETSMKFLDEIYAYQRQLDFEGLCHQVQIIENRVNMNICQGTGCTPLYMWEHEKKSLLPLVRQELRDFYKLHHSYVRVSNTHLISYKGCQYSVPQGYANKRVSLRATNGVLYIYDTTKLIAEHRITDKKKNIELEHYTSQVRQVQPYLSEEDSLERAKKNLERIDAIYATARRVHSTERKPVVSETKANAPTFGRKHYDS